MAGVTDEVRTVGEDLVAVGRAGLGLFLGGALAVGEADAGDDLAVRDVAVAVVVEDDALAVFGDDDDFDRLDGRVVGQVGGRGKGSRYQAGAERGCVSPLVRFPRAGRA